MILSGDDGGFGAPRAGLALHQNRVRKLERMFDEKENFARRAELDDRFLQRRPSISAGSAIAVFRTVGAAQANGDANRRRFRKELGQLADEINLESAGWSACLIGHGLFLSPELKRPPLLSLEKRFEGDSLLLDRLS